MFFQILDVSYNGHVSKPNIRPVYEFLVYETILSRIPDIYSVQDTAFTYSYLMSSVRGPTIIGRPRQSLKLR